MGTGVEINTPYSMDISFSQNTELGKKNDPENHGIHFYCLMLIKSIIIIIIRVTIENLEDKKNF